MGARANTGVQVEEPLYGGLTNTGLTTRVGETVRRPLRATSPATRALLDHLERVGFSGAPRYLGVDEQGREVVSYIHGSAVLPPYPDWALTDEALVSVAELMRGYHDAVRTFDARGHRWPVAVPDRFADGLVSHNDPNLDNIVFRDGRAVALIDFDLASPGSAAWDLACCGRLWVPLRDPRDCPEPLRGDTLRRLALFVEAYGASSAERTGLADAVADTHEWCYRIVRGAVGAGHEAFRRYWLAEGAARADRTRRWLAAHDREIRVALSVR
ncbi:MAG TPA: phosphotransferase [Solirubrobacteraceae bacterium]|nr:phosphotransferase [Solirubrobacteraceae bacterium]